MEKIQITNDEKAIMEIATNASKIIDSKYHAKISPEAIPTVVYAMLKETIVWLAKNKSTDEIVEIDFLGLMEMGITHRDGEEGGEEKDGNFTPFIRPGQKFKKFIKGDDKTETEE